MNKYLNASLPTDFIHSFNLAFDLTNVNSSVFKFNIPDDITLHNYTSPSNIKPSDEYNQLSVFAFFYLQILVKNNLITHNQIPAFLHSIHAFHSSSFQNLISYFFDNFENIDSAYQNLHSKISKKTTKTNDITNEIVSNIDSITNSTTTNNNTIQNTSDDSSSENSKRKTKKLKIKKTLNNNTTTTENIHIENNVIENTKTKKPRIKKTLLNNNATENNIGVNDETNHVINVTEKNDIMNDVLPSGVNATENIKIKFKKPRTKKILQN